MQAKQTHCSCEESSFDKSFEFPVPLMNNNNNSIIGFNLFHLYFWRTVKPSVPAKNQVLTSPLAFPVPLLNNNNNSIIGFNLFPLYFWHAVTHAHQFSTPPKIKKRSRNHSLAPPGLSNKFSLNITPLTSSSHF